MKPVCPFVKIPRPDDSNASKKPSENSTKYHVEHESKVNKEVNDSASVSPKCPMGYDSQTFKLGPLSCMVCQALLFDTSKCVPCLHVFCKACISRFEDCPLCGADIVKIEPDDNLQGVVDRFIEGHARIKRSVNLDKGEEATENNKPVIYEDVSLERGSFLVQQAMRAFRAQNLESAKSRLSLCAEDIRSQIEKVGNTSELCSQLGAVLGMLGDCCRAMGDSSSAVTYFEESVEFLSKLPKDDLEITHTLSVSLNKIGDLKYHGGDLQAARSYYFQSLNVRRDVVKNNSNVSSQVLDVAVSLAKVADVDKSLGDEKSASDGFQEAINLLESLTLKSEASGLEQVRLSVLDFLRSQLTDDDKQEQVKQTV
ncbi:variant 3, Protein nca1 [Lathyrus oleraceus]|uniref:Variant 2, Protein nca1 n=1 Tax=Pisum sativum TaxID=3888 RepID=A0A9D4XGA8_PEA|nr:variant 2, Protein nca1 [Pisum sativum]KAI5420687.1 variant 7, Protein nca1 [Pisum sativum]KAI5420688.1 variant 8, Protein nca1 [Pisum sativum]KAI5420704.1 variant 3, Protein nca1 [Pisum sativum]